MPGLLVRRLVASLASLLLLAACGEPATSDPTPDPMPSAIPNQTGVSAREVVDDPASRLLDVAIAPGDTDVRAAIWKHCPGDDCSTMGAAVALTVDGFASRVVPDRVWHFNPLVRTSASGETLVVEWDERLDLTLAHPDGSTAEVRRTGLTAPVAPGEIVGGVAHDRRGATFFATDPARGVAHPIPVPEGTVQLLELPSGQLRVTTTQRTYAWSDDGGSSRQEVSGASDGTLLQSFVASTPDVHALTGGSDGATLFPFNQIRRMDSWDSWWVVDQPGDPLAYIGPAAVLPDGRFLASVQSWSDDGRLDQPLKGTPPGIYVSEGADWSAYERIDSGAPFETPARAQPMVVDIEVNAEGAVMTALGPDQTTAWTSTDLGVTWHEMRAR